MKVVELLQEEDYDSYIARLVKSLGIKQLGTGYYGKVFQHPVYHNVAVKIYLKDPAYDAYIKWCLENQGNKYIPRIIDVVQYVDKDTPTHRLGAKYKIVFFEKLSKALAEKIKEAVREIVKKVLDAGFDITDSGTRNGKFFTSCTKFGDFYYDDWRSIAKAKIDPDLTAFAEFMASSRSSPRRLDMHNANVMLRGNQIVFTDPVS